MKSATFYPDASRYRTRERSSNRSNARSAPSQLAFNVALLVLGVGLGVSLGLPLVDGTLTELKGAGGIATFIGSITGLVGTYLALLMVVFASRMPALERVLGQVGVIRWHRNLAPWPIILITIHAVLITIGYAEAAKQGFFAYAGVLINTFPHIVTATVALAVMLFIGIISIKPIRIRIARENWWLVHLLMYVALILAFAHEVVLGPSFVKHPLAQYTWTGAWLVVAGLILVFRIGLPIYRSFRYKLKVVEVKPEGPGVVSVILKGRNLEKLKIQGGQFFEWRFLTKGMWWQAHPFSISALPEPPYLRMTVRGVGDFSRALSDVKVGTPVAIEGPYGSFTAASTKNLKVLLVAGGVGVTAIRSLLEDLAPKSKPVVILRANREDEVILGDEVEEIVRHKKGIVHRLIGDISEVSLDVIPVLVPDITERDVFICGSEGFVNQVQLAVLRVGVPFRAIHEEAFSL